ncbi:YIP1 family protein [Albimonas pacifica]|uniref:Yip1 domain-containing protein n=1 Tax=Albimonas pacifica TaxID=1114924 RepID=A0A1I3D7I8_9RHOB|nr:YIP1 family protein [Albimonas pacifica]SFH82700.1 Yip1 domain-containing protein [Albimonas pacifica]
MILEFLKTVAMAYRAPRRSARAMLDRAPSMTDCALMVVLATLVQAMFGAVVDLAMGGDGPSMSALGARMTEVALNFFMFAVLTAGAYWLGRRFGGKAQPADMARVVAWHLLVTAFLAPLNLLGIHAITSANPEDGASALALLAPVSVGLSIWLFAAFVAEAHGFRRVGLVAVATVGGFIALGFATMILATLFSLAPPPA